MSEIRIRSATLDDAETLAMFNRAMAEETEGRELKPSVVLEGVRHALESPECDYYVAERGGAVVGCLMLTREFSDWRNGTFWWIQSVYVQPQHRDQGVFRHLFEHVKRVAGRAGSVCGLRLYVEDENVRAMEIYQHLGMRDASYRVFELDWA